MSADKKREPFADLERIIQHGGIILMKRARCFLCCVHWRNVILYLLLIVLTVVLLTLLPRWVLCFLVIALLLGCGALLLMRS